MAEKYVWIKNFAQGKNATIWSEEADEYWAERYGMDEGDEYFKLEIEENRGRDAFKEEYIFTPEEFIELLEAGLQVVKGRRQMEAEYEEHPERFER